MLAKALRAVEYVLHVAATGVIVSILAAGIGQHLFGCEPSVFEYVSTATCGPFIADTLSFLLSIGFLALFTGAILVIPLAVVLLRIFEYLRVGFARSWCTNPVQNILAVLYAALFAWYFLHLNLYVPSLVLQPSWRLAALVIIASSVLAYVVRKKEA